MCGIAGYISKASTVDSILNMGKMLKAIERRGPDDEGVWVDNDVGIAIGHRRLSIVDLSAAGHQPMISNCGRFVIAFNGEIYNHSELRKKVEQKNNNSTVVWRGTSDTESLLACISVFGLSETLKICVGMFAIALWDRKLKNLMLARDRVGEKPLYYGWIKDEFIFGSELKSIKGHPNFIGQVNVEAAKSFSTLNYVRGPHTIYKDIYKLTPGTYLCLKQEDISQHQVPEPIKYWSLLEAMQSGSSNPYLNDRCSATQELEQLLANSVNSQSIADVNVGAFLSGGIDSSLVVALMKRSPSSKITTFSVGMDDTEHDESKYARLVAKYLGTNHIELELNSQKAFQMLSKIPEVWDEPFADSSQLPTYLLSNLAKKHVSVALTGDGGDEFYLGYSHYQIINKIWKLRGLNVLPIGQLVVLLRAVTKNSQIQKFCNQLENLSKAWSYKNQVEFLTYWNSRAFKNQFLVENSIPPICKKMDERLNIIDTSSLWDAQNYLTDDVLVKVDRAAMYNSLETRAPLLDHRIIEFAYRLPLHYKLKDGVGKKVLRDILYQHVPRQLVDRPKMGFGIPLDKWLRGDFKEWVADNIADIPDNSAFISKVNVQKAWQAHLLGANNTSEIWNLMNLLPFIRNIH